MLESPESNRLNLRTSLITATALGLGAIALGFAWPPGYAGLALAVILFLWMRRRTKRRLQVMAQPFPEDWQWALETYVEFYLALDADQQVRFQNMMKVFLDEVPVTGVRTDVDETTRALVAASAVIPVFGFDDWEYSRLGEVLIYPGGFDTKHYAGDGGADQNTIGMVGVKHLSGVMILSKPDLIAGFENSKDKRNVGIHEFAHLVDLADGEIDGIPAGVPSSVVVPWIEWVGGELNRPVGKGEHIDDYAFTNEAEYFAVLTEYFFEAPEKLAQRDPQTYEMMQSMYRQNTRKILGGAFKRRPTRIGRNAPCPCGSDQKYKRCCRRKQMRGRH